MKQDRLFFIFGMAVLALSGCTGGGRGGRGGSTSKTSAQPTSNPTSEQGTSQATSEQGTSQGTSEGGTSETSGIDPLNFEKYEERYCNKIDCFGNPVADYELNLWGGEDLALQIHYYCVDQHKTYLTYRHSPANYGDYFRECDRDLDTGQTIQFYTGKRGNPAGREHVWPCANSDDLWYRQTKFYEHKIDDTSYDYWGGGSDIYNLHSITYDVNTDRGNAKFVMFEGSERNSLKTISDGGPYTLLINQAGNRCEPAKEYRGNIARIAMYMWCHYRQMGTRNAYYPSNYASHRPVYKLEDAVTASSNHTPYMFSTGLSLDKLFGYTDTNKMYEVIMQWNREDPPDESEKYANDYIEKELQGNRNPFIDYPQLVDNILLYL